MKATKITDAVVCLHRQTPGSSNIFPFFFTVIGCVHHGRDANTRESEREMLRVTGFRFCRKLSSRATTLFFSVQQHDTHKIPAGNTSHARFSSDQKTPSPSRQDVFFRHIDVLPPTAADCKNPTARIEYDESVHERFPPGGGGDPGRRAFAYLVLSGGRFAYASVIRLLVLKFLLSMAPTRDVLALASMEVDLSGIEPGSVATVKWRGKPVFVWHRTEEDVALANRVDLRSLRDPQADSDRVIRPEWLVVVGVCTHLGCIPLPHVGEFGGWFCPCHGSNYDSSGRARKGPAQTNLEVPPYQFMGKKKLLLGA